MTTMKFENLPKDAIDSHINLMLAANPRIRMTRSEWIEYINMSYDIKTVKTDSHTHIFLEPKDLESLSDEELDYMVYVNKGGY